MEFELRPLVRNQLSYLILMELVSYQAVGMTAKNISTLTDDEWPFLPLIKDLWSKYQNWVKHLLEWVSQLKAEVFIR